MARGDGSGDQARDADALLDPERASPKAKSPKHSASASTREVGTAEMLQTHRTARRLPAFTCFVVRACIRPVSPAGYQLHGAQLGLSALSEWLVRLHVSLQCFTSPCLPVCQGGSLKASPAPSAVPCCSRWWSQCTSHGGSFSFLTTSSR